MVVVRIMQVNRFSFSSAFVFFQFFIAPGVIVSRNLGDIFGRQIMILKGILLFSIPTISEVYFANVSMLTVAFFCRRFSRGCYCKCNHAYCWLFTKRAARFRLGSWIPNQYKTQL
jgi:MFS family permease